jgi:hypothetical protein
LPAVEAFMLAAEKASWLFVVSFVSTGFLSRKVDHSNLSLYHSTLERQGKFPCKRPQRHRPRKGRWRCGLLAGWGAGKTKTAGRRTA